MSGIDVLSSRLCPWLEPALRHLEDARSHGRLGHAWVIGGPAGVGKINLALFAADRWLRGQPLGAPVARLEPADAAAAVAQRHTPADHHPDLHWLFPEEGKSTISVEQIRDAIAALSLKAYRGESKVVIIEPADGMTPAAANALLKTLEEPTAGTYLLLLSHRPTGLPATIRSRCQRLTVEQPSARAVQAWLGSDVPASSFDELWLLTGGAPLKMAVMREGDIARLLNDLQDQVVQVSEDRQDAQTVAERWLKDDPELALEWLLRRLERVIRFRLAPGASTSFTDPGADALHNVWRKLTLGGLFEQHRQAERLLADLHGGRNMELGLRVLLLGFQAPSRMT
jgi:DNA polymerase-3 subunit delta'